MWTNGPSTYVPKPNEERNLGRSLISFEEETEIRGEEEERYHRLQEMTILVLYS